MGIKKNHKLKAVVVGIKLKASRDSDQIESSMDEIESLLKTLDVKTVGRFVQVKDSPSPATYVGPGKVEELANFCKKNKINIVAFDVELSSAQARNLENLIGVEVLDRTEIILEIFSNHARTKEAKIQVDIAKQEFMLTRLLGLWGHFDRQRGGIGLRDAGEKQIEMDRRILRDRISKLKKELRHLDTVRKTQRKLRSQVLQVALVGYTNAGKTTLMNGLTQSELLVEDKLFATLDSTVKILNPNNRPKILISDTVGFIDKLPHKLIASFKSTLDELFSADLIVHVVDISSGNYEKNIEVTDKVLDELKVGEKPSFIVFNKVDRLNGSFLLPKILKRKYLESIAVSALDRDGVLDLRNKIIDFFENQMLRVKLEVPYINQEKLSDIFDVSKVLEKKYKQDCVYLELKIADMHYCRLNLEKFKIRS